MLKDPERLSNSVLATFDLVYSLDSIPYSSYEVATTRALFPRMERCFLVNKKEGDFGLVELEKEDNIPKYLNELLEEHGFEIKINRKGRIIKDLTKKFFVPAYFIMESE